MFNKERKERYRKREKNDKNTKSTHVSLETHLVSFKSFPVSCECTTSTNALYCSNTQSH